MISGGLGKKKASQVPLQMTSLLKGISSPALCACCVIWGKKKKSLLREWGHLHPSLVPLITLLLGGIKLILELNPAMKNKQTKGRGCEPVVP